MRYLNYYFYSDSAGPIGSVALLALRLVVGAAFMHHGWSKIQNPFGWMGPHAAMPAVLQALAAISEFGGGMALIPGLLTRLASLGITAVMVVALATVHLPMHHPFVTSKPGGPSYELAAVYLACATLFLLAGPGRYSLDSLLSGLLPAQNNAGRDAPEPKTLVTPSRRRAE